MVAYLLRNIQNNLPTDLEVGKRTLFVLYYHGLINYKDTNEKCRLLEKLTCIGTLRHASVYLSVAQNPMPLFLTHCIRVYSILIHTGKGGGVEPESRGEGQHRRVQIPKLGRKYQHD